MGIYLIKTLFDEQPLIVTSIFGTQIKKCTTYSLFGINIELPKDPTAQFDINFWLRCDARARTKGEVDRELEIKEKLKQTVPAIFRMQQSDLKGIPTQGVN